jgi:hypothetical protein
MVNFDRLAMKAANEEVRKGANAVMHIGSTLHQEDIFYNSDLDVLAIYPKSLPPEASRAEYRFDKRNGIEVNIIREPEHRFCAKLAAGNPFEITSMKFGRPLVGKRVFDNMAVPEPTTTTAMKWMDNAAWHFTRMMMEYQMIDDIQTFYTTAQKAARSALRAAVLVKTRKLVETNAELIQNAEPDPAWAYLELLGLRRESEKYVDTFKAKEVRRIAGSVEARAFLKAEYLVRYGAKEVLSLSVPTVNAVLRDAGRHDERYRMGMLDFKDRKLTVLLSSKPDTPMRTVSVPLL